MTQYFNHPFLEQTTPFCFFSVPEKSFKSKKNYPVQDLVWNLWTRKATKCHVKKLQNIKVFVDKQVSGETKIYYTNECLSHQNLKGACFVLLYHQESRKKSEQNSFILRKREKKRWHTCTHFSLVNLFISPFMNHRNRQTTDIVNNSSGDNIRGR
jgi:hypothetical protein